MGKQEHVILVDVQGQAIGIQDKYAVHTSHTPLHLAFSCWLFNPQGECLVTRRALSKKAWPGVWTNSVCGHPQKDETFEQAIARRCRYEVGVEIDTITVVEPAFRYCETDPSGIVENEICPVYAAHTSTPVNSNQDEVMDYRWVELDALLHALDAAPWAFSPWMVKEATAAKETLRAFAANAKQ
jgi:isopentenyl-diphosphate delta-isomerase